MVKKVIKAGANWCGPCRVYSPIFHKVSEMPEFEEIEFESADIDEEENEEMVEKYKMMSVPTTLVLDENGRLLHKEHGIMMEGTLVSLLNNLIESEKMK